LNIIKLKKHEENRLLSGHLWIYSNEINVQKTPLKQFEQGELVVVESDNGNSLGVAYVNPNTLLCGRLLTRNSQQAIDEQFFAEKIMNAVRCRELVFPKPFYRVIYGESDGLPGLVVDRFGDYLVMQINTAGMEKLKSILINAFISALKPKGILMKNDMSVRELEGLSKYVEVAYGEFPDELLLEENDVAFSVPAKTGQKTGWFYDHRFNRQRLNHYVKGKSVLDLFSYVGGWGVQAAVHGATKVVCVDSSQLAIDYVTKNAGLNKVGDRVTAIKGDVAETIDRFISGKEKFGVVIIDPPALIKRVKDIPAGAKAYQKLNRMAMQVLNSNGLLATSSCSMHFSKDLLIDAIRRASISSQEPLRIIEQFHQAQDHPVHPAIKETDYLKGFLIKS
jgi:23S rRNA (cytosine1962-C5)-methyltransferase